MGRLETERPLLFIENIITSILLERIIATGTLVAQFFILSYLLPTIADTNEFLDTAK